MRSYNSIRTYDKSNNLVGYIEFSNEFKQPKCYYSVQANVLNRIHVNEYRGEDTPIFESINSVIEFDNNIMLTPLYIDGEIRMEVINSGATSSCVNYNSPGISDRFDTYLEFNSGCTNLESFRLKSNLIDDCLNKL